MTIIETVIKGSKVCRLAMVDQDKPYVIPMSFGYDGSLYCVAWVNTPPLGAQYLSRYPVRLQRGGLHFCCSEHSHENRSSTGSYGVWSSYICDFQHSNRYGQKGPKGVLFGTPDLG